MASISLLIAFIIAARSIASACRDQPAKSKAQRTLAAGSSSATRPGYRGAHSLRLFLRAISTDTFFTGRIHRAEVRSRNLPLGHRAPFARLPYQSLQGRDVRAGTVCGPSER